MLRQKLSDVASSLRDQISAFCESVKVPGYVAGVYQAGKQIVLAHGLANVTTGAAMREDTGFLFGSVTKLMTTTLILQQVERGVLSLDEYVVTYLPEFKLAAPFAAEKIRVLDLLSHTNGIDADLFFLDGSGDDALKIYLAGLADHCGSLFNPGEYISYSNGGMILAGRLLEVVTGMSYHELLKINLFQPAGMEDACTSAKEAILRSTAVGHFPDTAGKGAGTTEMFMLPETWAPAGSTPIGTVNDLLSFGQTHLAKGLSPTGKRVLSPESVAKMQTVSHDMQTPNVPPLGLGWVMMPYGPTTVLTMSGASPGGVAVLAILPEFDLAFAAFGNDSRALALHDQLLLWLLQSYCDVKITDLLTQKTAVSDLTPYAGTYRSHQMRIEVSIVDGQLEEKMIYEPLDDKQWQIFTKFTGGAYPVPPRRFMPVQEGLFAPAGMPLQSFNGFMRQLLVSYHGFQNGQMTYRCAGGRMTRRAEAV